MKARRQAAGWGNLVIGALLMFAAWVLVTVLFARPEFKVLWDLSPQARFTVAQTERPWGEIRSLYPGSISPRMPR